MYSLLENLPQELLNKIAKILKGEHKKDLSFTIDNKNIRALSITNKNFNNFFNNQKEYWVRQLVNDLAHRRFDKAQAILENYPQLLLIKLLHHVAFGQQSPAQRILEHHPQLIFSKARVNDYSGRIFYLSPFQYACWAGDRQMVLMMLRELADSEKMLLAQLCCYEDAVLGEKFFSKNEIDRELMFLKNSLSNEQKEQLTSQLKELNNYPEKLSKHGSCYDFTPLLKAYDYYLLQEKNCKENLRAIKEYWAKTIGGLQCLVPAWLAQEYLNRYRAFPGLKDILNPWEFSREDSAFGRDENYWFPLPDPRQYHSFILGYNSAFLRSSKEDFAKRDRYFGFHYNLERLGSFAYLVRMSEEYSPYQVRHLIKTTKIDFNALNQLATLIIKWRESLNDSLSIDPSPEQSFY